MLGRRTKNPAASRAAARGSGNRRPGARLGLSPAIGALAECAGRIEDAGAHPLLAESQKKGWNGYAKRKTYNPPVDPEKECKKKGWNWDGKRCLAPLKALKPQIKPLDPAALCKAKGWVWTSKRCVPPGASTVPR